jgi:hypothetical protein
MPVSMLRDLLLPVWIMSFGLVILSAPPLGVGASLSLFLLGVVVLPALVLVRIIQRDPLPVAA